MNIINNALSAKNIRIHGMSTPKWTTKDKITQYKGLVNLYKRDHEITEVDTAVATKRQNTQLKNLRKAIDADRHNLDNAMGGDKQKLWNTLAEQRDLQLAYQDTDPKTVVDNIIQINFSKRKVLDKLRYQLKQKSQELIDLKLEQALLQDRLKYESNDKIPLEKTAQIITGKVQDALLKKEAALAIKQTYTQIIDVMKKDDLYFDGVLQAIQNDFWYQRRCILNAIKQGQLATEYKNDREVEFAELETAVMEDLRSQKSDLEQARKQAESLHSNLKVLIRRDSDLTTCVLKVCDTQDFEMLRKDLIRIEGTLKFLRDTTLVSSFDQIYPSLFEQRKQKNRLVALAKKCAETRDIILNKLNHAELMSNMLQNTMVETTGDYKKRKEELQRMVAEQNQRKIHCQKSRLVECRVIAHVRLALRQMLQLCKPIKAPLESDKKQRIAISSPWVQEDECHPPDEDETDGTKIITDLRPKLTFLMANLSEHLEESKVDAAYRYYELLIKERSFTFDKIEEVDESFFEGFTSEGASHLLTREDIKKQSDELVAANAKEDDMITIMPEKPKKWKPK